MVPSAPEAMLTESAGLTAEVRALLAAAAAADGIAPLSEGLLEAAAGQPWSMLDVRLGEELIGFGIAAAQGERGALEAVIAPDHRGRGYGRMLIDALLERAGHPVWMWSHGDLPAAAAIAAAHRFTRSRELLQLQTGPVAELQFPDRPIPEGVRLRSFSPGDEAGWLRVNNAAFDWHPEQGRQELADIRAIVEAPGFDPDSVIIATRTGTSAEDGTPATGTSAAGEAIIGFHQTKLSADHPSGRRVGEVYVIATDPAVHARGVGQALTVAGMRYLIGAGAEFIELYVESDNAPARRLYARLGFDREIMHVSYAPPEEA